MIAVAQEMVEMARLILHYYQHSYHSPWISLEDN